jgi:hypothetical protein
MSNQKRSAKDPPRGARGKRGVQRSENVVPAKGVKSAKPQKVSGVENVSLPVYGPVYRDGLMVVEWDPSSMLYGPLLRNGRMTGDDLLIREPRRSRWQQIKERIYWRNWLLCGPSAERRRARSQRLAVAGRTDDELLSDYRVVDLCSRMKLVKSINPQSSGGALAIEELASMVLRKGEAEWMRVKKDDAGAVSTSPTELLTIKQLAIARYLVPSPADLMLAEVLRDRTNRAMWRTARVADF